jgi:hypothetical protein
MVAIGVVLVLALSAAATQAVPHPAKGPGADRAGGKKCKHKHKRGSAKRCRRRPASPPVEFGPTLGATTPSEPVSISSNPQLFPDFDPQIHDYTARCTGDPVTVSGSSTAWPSHVSVSVDGHGPFEADFDQDVPLSPNQEFEFETSSRKSVERYYVRCLPSDFPAWNYERPGTPNQPFYVLALRRNPTGAAMYVVVFNDHGVPVWWRPATIDLGNAFALSDGTLSWARGDLSAYEIHQLDGTLVRTVSFQGSTTNDHDMQPLPNGDFLVISYKPRGTTVDLTPIGGAPDQMVRDAAIQEVDPDGNVVWEWNSKDHIGIDQIASNWRTQVATSAQPHDLLHLNSVEPDGDSVVISLRFTNAIYKISRDTGDIEWKLGGTTIPQSLTVTGDHPSSPFAGQHDARILPDGTLTLHDNETASGLPPRAVSYAIDETAGTATQLDSIEDPDITAATCCGSARLSPEGTWLISWGARSQVTEFAPSGDRNFKLTFGPNLTAAPFSYRAFPVPPGWLNVADLRAGMSIMYPR